ncbi:MAG TPA: hypothetical protein VI703_07015 [Anaerolineales bacterium]|jgi:hypothetical protein|nr:hypothetical protein [Anaerolineales bacterium]
MAEHTNEGQQYGPPFTDVLISLLGAVVVGGVVWAGGFGTVAAIHYAGQVFQIYPPANQLINTVIQSGFVAGPILAGLLAAWLTYRFLLKLD